MGFDFVTVNDPCSGEYVSGDGAVIHEFEHGLLVVIIDVLGHGEKAAKTARAMESYIKELCSSDIVWLMEKVHEHFLTSQGAAMTMVYFDRLTHQLKGVAIGNTLLRRCGEEWQSYHAQPGVVGELLPTLKPFHDVFKDGDTFLFTTDGIKENIDPESCQSFQYHSLGSFTHFLTTNFGKSYDDSTVIAVRYYYD
ncbi:SpoIIE family protein phosphatase [Vibrio vulnificus]|uniref:SpoIIE family protein phosphatase n=1 Tax=Vibrio vulnificus TaxID=672 RepID=UPI00102A4F26|nr:SpoIIE family protein phosphatase [Vibrio vulnificus]ELA3109458.1 SpoIIE family protein phosphatase [Vibrio vulnificus]ELB7529319.1 SpoIIE family protein phosphatase [Vibrio vulnificus]ELK2275383.1 SpoIIE family protein phosphatase [Vibrio vulnificus]MCA3967852.1 SpoIIE family protein phosphatase [Vibrio vulnificus]MCU8512334.1 serine/threonine-protein phosphatase [Vibrio vulnificus]